MQYDMHYYGTFAMAMAAGIPKEDAEIIAQSAQNVDDQNASEVEKYSDGSALLKVSTAHHPLAAGFRSWLPEQNLDDDARLVWLPFHFLPGGQGETFYEKIKCTKNSDIARAMLSHYLETPYARNGFGLQLAGIAAHVYADTFSHYGFSGISNELNRVAANSFEYGDRHSQKIISYIQTKKDKFEREDMLKGGAAGALSSLGHAGVNTMPDRPYLLWSFRYADGRSSGWRDNQTSFLQACESLYDFFAKFAKQRYDISAVTQTPWDEIKGAVSDILFAEGSAEDRVSAWKSAISAEKLGHVKMPVDYKNDLWASDQKMNRLFHSAADYHRTYILRVLLPKYGIHAV